MIPLGLTASEQAAFHRALLDSHDIDVRVSLLTLEEDPAGDLSSWILGGQVVVDNYEAVTRSCQLTVLDPEGRAGIDPDRPGDSTYLDRMISVNYGVWVSELDRWVRVPVFRGPIVKASRDGDVLEIEALGKEHLLRGETGWTKMYPANSFRTWVIRDIAYRSGERRMSVPDWKPRTSKSTVMVKIRQQSVPWDWMQVAAKSMSGNLWYDGAGMLRLRKNPTRQSWTFTEDQLLSVPKVTVDDQELFNAVWVKGQAPEGKKFVVEARGQLPASHPNSPVSLGRHGARRIMTDFIEDDSIRTSLEALGVVNRRIRELQIARYEVEFECLPVPHLDPHDVALLAWDEMPTTFRLRRWTLPLVAGESMAVGFARMTTRSRAVIAWNRRRQAAYAAQVRRAAAKRTKNKK